MAELKPLSVPQVSRAHFERNFIREAVCELRFPILFSLAEARPPAPLVQALRKEYPNYQQMSDIGLNAGSVAQSYAHSFKSKKGDWAIMLRSSAITLSSYKYDSFDHFEERIASLAQAAKAVIDSEFFTRVGLRYVNCLPYSVDEISEWVNPLLVGALGSGVFGDVFEHHMRVTGTTRDDATYTFMHGIGTNPQTAQLEYVLDLDFGQDDIPIDETAATARRLHDHEYSMFTWALGERAKQHLGPSTL